MPSWKKVITSGSNASLNSLYAPSITGSLLGTASFAITASYALTSSFSLATTENRILVMNKSGATITKGMVVHLTGSNNSSDTPYVVTASYESDSLSANTLGIAYQTITANDTGYVVTEGVLTGIDVTGYISGQVLYLGATGSIIGTAPTAPLHSVRLGQVVRDSPSNNGSIYVRIDNGYELGELHDVKDTTTTSSYGDLLVKSGSVWINSNQLTGSYAITGSLIATSFTGSLFGTASYATQALSSSFALTTTSASYALNATTATTASYVLNAISASFASTASFVNTLNQNVLITGSLTVGANSIGASENTLTLGPRDNGSEGGQLMLQAPGGTYTSASMWDNYANQTRLLRGSNAGSDALVASFNMHTKQMQLAAYNNVSSFPGTAAAFLAVDSSGNLITTSSAGGGGGGVTINNNVDNYVITGTGTLNTLNGESNLQFNGASLTVTGQITSSGAIISQANGAMYFRGGDDAEFWDINVANTVGIYGQQTQTVAGLKLGSAGATLYGSGSRFGIATTSPVATLDVNGNLYVASGITGSLFGTSSWANNATTAQTASYVLQAVSASFASTASSVNQLNQIVNVGAGIQLNNTTADISATSFTAGGGAVQVDGILGEVTATTFIGNLNGTASYATQALSASYAPSTPTFPYTGDARISGSLGVTGSFSTQTFDGTNYVPAISISDISRTIYDTLGASSFDADSRDLYDSAAINSINWEARRLIDSTGVVAMRWDLRSAYDTVDSQSIDWSNRLLKIDNGPASYTVNWNTGILRDTNAKNSIDWQNRIAIDTANKDSINWQNRQLKDSTGTEIVNWTSGVSITGSATVSGSLTVTGSLLITGSSTLINQGPTILSGSFKVQGEGDGLGGPITTAITVDDINFTRKLHDSQTGSGSLDFANRDLLDQTGNGAFNWTGVAATIDSRLYINQTVSAAVRNQLLTNVGTAGQLLNDVAFDSLVQTNDLVYLGNDGAWYQVDQTTDSSTRMLGICMGYDPMTYIGKVLLEGDVIVSTGPGYPSVAGAGYGSPVYIKEGAGTAMSTTVPVNDYVRLLGYCYHEAGGTEWIMKFRPSNNWYVI